MFRLWGKLWNNTHMENDFVYEEESEDTRTHKIFRGIEKICDEFNLATPIWLDKNIAEFKRTDKVRFSQDNFIEEFPYSYFEIHIIEED